MNKHTIGLNFNYTDVAEKYFEYILHPHGSLKEKEIVLGYDPLDYFELSLYENKRWQKELCRERLEFIRRVRDKLKLSSEEQPYQELCQDFEFIQRLSNSGKGWGDPEDLLALKHAECFKDFILTPNFGDIFANKGVFLGSISKVIVLGHSINSDESYLKRILSQCVSLQQVVIFSYEGEKQKDWDVKAHFFDPYCASIIKEMF